MKKWFFLFITFTMVLLGCGESTKYHYKEPKVLLAYNYVAPPSCGKFSQVKPYDLAPQGVITDTNPNPTFSWAFDFCDVYTFTVELDTNPTTSGYWLPYFMGTVDGTQNSLTPSDAALEPCTTYFWKVTGNGAILYESNVASFMIDNGSCPQPHTCPFGTGTPELISPFYDPYQVQFYGPNPQLVWYTYDQCLADNYHYEVSTTPDFNQIVLEGDTTDTMVSPTDPYLEDCSLYFWRVTSTANGYSRTSPIGEFETNFGAGSCEKPSCTAEQLTAPDLVQPADHSTVNEPFINFLWKNNSTCQPAYYKAEIDDDPNFSVPSVLAKTSKTWTIKNDPKWFNHLKICQPYYWRVTAFTEDGQTSATSDVGVFLYSPNGMVCGLANFQQSNPVEFVNDFSLGCVSSSQMWALFDFNGPICGDYEVHIGNRVWPCQFTKGSISQLLCYGALAPQQTESPVSLFMVGGDEPILTENATTPQCAGATSGCQPPAEGCSPKVTIDPTGAPILTSTHWDSSQCKCVP